MLRLTIYPCSEQLGKEAGLRTQGKAERKSAIRIKRHIFLYFDVRTLPVEAVYRLLASGSQQTPLQHKRRVETAQNSHRSTASNAVPLT